MIRKTFVILLLIVPVLMLFSQGEAMAVANGDGTCSAEEATRGDCGVFNSGVIEFLGTEFVRDRFGYPATKYKYFYAGPATNQIDLAIPLNITQHMNTASLINCSQWYPTGGDPTTGFGAYFTTEGVCRTAPTGSSAPNITIYVDPSVFELRPWVVRFDKNNIFAQSINGPGVPQTPVTETGATYTSGPNSISYTNIGGTLTITSGSGRIVPVSEMKLCILNVGGDPAVFPGDYTCEFMEFVSEQCLIKTTGFDPCIMVGNKCINF